MLAEAYCGDLVAYVSEKKRQLSLLQDYLVR